MRVRTSAPPQGLLRHRALGSEALYRVVGAAPGIVEVEVVRAPGLERGSHLRLTADAARGMEHVAVAVDAAGARALAGAL